MGWRRGLRDGFADTKSGARDEDFKVRLRSIGGPLDRYVFSEFWRIFVSTALGFPLLMNVIDLTDNLDKYLQKNLSVGKIALSYVYGFPDSVFLILPAATLFATVFSVGALTRHSEITAAKASGISFYRIIAPILFGALLATSAGLIIGELSPGATKKKEELLGNRKRFVATERYNFAYTSDGNRTYKVATLNQASQGVTGLLIDRLGSWPDYPEYIMSVGGGTYRGEGDGWMLTKGAIHLMENDSANITFAFDSVLDRRLTERPQDLAIAPSAPADMGFRELSDFIAAMERSGADVNTLKVERMLKIAIPFTSLVIVLFGAPLATSNQRGGATFGIGISLATTVIFLMMIQATKAFGAKGIISADIAAWIPNILFGIIAVTLMMRVRT